MNSQIWHKFEVWFLKNRSQIMFYSFYVVLVFNLLVTSLALSEIYKLANTNKQMLKGVVCTLLILPEDRTVKNINECFDKNRDDINSDKFQFRASQTNQPEVLALQESTAPIASTPASLSKEEYKTNYLLVPTKSSSYPTQPPPRTYETIQNEETGKTTYQYEGTTLQVSQP